MVFRPKFNFKANDSDDSIIGNDTLKTLLLLGIACLLYGISVGINLSSFSMFLAKHGLETREISEILSMEIIGNICIAPFMLLLVRLVGMYNIILTSLIFRNFFLAFFGFGDEQFMWSVGMFGFGVSGFILYTGVFQWVNSILDNRFRATYLSLASVFFGLGIAFGPILMVMLDIEVGNDTFLVSLCICMSMIIPIIMTKNRGPSSRSYNVLSISKIFKYAYIPMICAIACEYAFFSINEFLPLYALENDKPQYEAYLLVSYFGFSGIVLGIPFGIIIDRYDRLRVIMIFALIISVLMQLLPSVIDNIYLTILIFTPLSACINGIIVGGLAFTGDKFKGDDFTAVNTTVHALSTIGGYAGIKTTGNLIDIMGGKGFIFSVSSLFLVFLALLVLETYRTRTR